MYTGIRLECLVLLIVLMFLASSRSEVNIALTGSAAQSTDRELSRWKAPQGIDGCTNQNIGSGCCAHTKDGRYKEAWWRVDLGQTMTIQNITIYYRGG
ncbi:fucolectin-4-like [Argopecten irradians]|uniref:fucolectin-4-like n=1 Tax=Argopecten irradians TaxID=31199 RepID=UPI0037123344